MTESIKTKENTKENTKKKITIALVAHDGMKRDMVAWVNRNRKVLRQFNLVGTEGTAKAINKTVSRLEVKSLGDGPYGGDISVAYWILKSKIHILIFLVDTTVAHSHQPDIQALERTCIAKKIPFALNIATADCILQVLLQQE